jgi:hypothetical protein
MLKAGENTSRIIVLLDMLYKEVLSLLMELLFI